MGHASASLSIQGKEQRAKSKEQRAKSKGHRAQSSKGCLIIETALIY